MEEKSESPPPEFSELDIKHSMDPERTLPKEDFPKLNIQTIQSEESDEKSKTHHIINLVKGESQDVIHSPQRNEEEEDSKDILMQSIII